MGLENGRLSILKPAIAPRSLAVTLGVSALVLLADQSTKQWIVTHFQPHDLILDLPYISLVFVTNTGGVCGYAQGANALLAAVGAFTAALIGAAIWFLMPGNLPHAASFGLLLAGALGNLIDRLRLGYVVDFITVDLVLRLPSFNLADTAIMAGIGLMGFLTVWEMVQESRKKPGQILRPLGRSTAVFLLAAGLLLAGGYVLCVFRPFQ